MLILFVNKGLNMTIKIPSCCSSCHLCRSNSSLVLENNRAECHVASFSKGKEIDKTLVPLSKLKSNSIALIKGFSINGKDKGNAYRYRLIAMGLVPGRNVQIVQKAYGMFVAKVADDNSIGISKSAAEAILVKPLIEDSKFRESFLSKIFKFFTTG